VIRIRHVFVAFLLLAGIAPALADGDCGAHFPFGQPEIRGEADVTLVCHTGYAAMHDNEWFIPRYVSYVLEGKHTLGCNKRGNNFHPEQALPKDRRATPADYIGSGYDRGHMAPAADFAHDKKQMADSFSMANMAPQRPKLNRLKWEEAEEHQRASAYERGKLLIYVGTIVGKRHATIGDDFVAVPQGFFKVLVDLSSHATEAFMAPNEDAPKGDLSPWLTSIADVEESAGLTLPLPEGVDREEVPALWGSDVNAWKKKHAAACAR
jgi:endonuclease G, mitochondrial